MPITAPLKVVHAVPDLLFGGLQRLVVQMATRADPARFDVRVLVFGELSPLADDLVAAGRVERVGPQGRLSLLWPTELTGHLRRLRPDVVHSHSGVWLKTALAARRAGCPRVIHTDHGRLIPDPWQARLVDRLASRLTDVVVAVSAPLGERLERGVGVDPARITVLINGVDTDALIPGGQATLRKELGIPDHAWVIGSIGRLEHIKGYDVLVEAAGQLRALGPERPVVVLLVGDGDEREALEARAKALGVDGSIRFLGWRQDVAHVLASCDLFSLTSRSEGTSVSLLEAMSAGVCPVVTDVGGNRDVLGPELAHRLARSEDPASIAAQWMAALADPARRDVDARVARRRVEARYSFRAMMAGNARLYRPEPEGSAE